ncbi:MAG TPA: hypothetical protein VK843_02980 [Planctomycetota bacterium]|nr:hypothetical protein [Planctomycetota bacterium]
MNRRLIALVARRFLPPGALALFAAALALAMFIPWAPSAEQGADQLVPEVSAGLARAGVLLTALAVILPWFCARAAWCVGQWRQGDGDWLGTARLSRGGVALAHLCGAGLALAVALLPFAFAAELRAGDAAPRLRWLADSAVRPVVLLTESDRVQVVAPVPRGGDVLRARFVIAAPGNGGPQARLRCDIARSGARNASVEVLVTSNDALEVQLAGGVGPLELGFQRVGPGAAVVLESSRLQWFESKPARWKGGLALFLEAWLAGGVVCALALGLAAWTSAGTAFLAAFSPLCCAWLSDSLPIAWPGVGLRGALALCSDGLGAGWPALLTWTFVAIVCALAAALPALQRDLWRREV